MISRWSKLWLSIAAVLATIAAAIGIWFWQAVPVWIRGERSNLFGTKGKISYPFNSYGVATILARELPNSASPGELRAWAVKLFGTFPHGTTGASLAVNDPQLPRGLSNFLQHFPAPNLPWAVSIHTNEHDGARMEIHSLGGFGSRGIIVLTSATDGLNTAPNRLTLAPGVYVQRTP